MPQPRFVRRPARLSAIPFIDIPPARDVIICATPDGYTFVYLHYLGRTSVLCFGGECAHCKAHGEPELYAYAPALFKPHGNGDYHHGLLPVGNPFGELCQRDWRGNLVELDKPYRKDGTTGQLLIGKVTAIDPVILSKIGAEWFDIKPRLLQRWKIDPAVLQGQLPFEALPEAPSSDQADEGQILPFRRPAG